MQTMKVADILSVKGADVVTIREDEPIAAAIALLARNRIGAVLVVDQDNTVKGIFSERDVVHALHQHRADLFDKRVADLMTREVVTCLPGDNIAAIMAMMTSGRFRHIPVLEDGKLAGIISIGDVVKSRIAEAESEVDALRRYISL
jgi:CBS domain-containing protein